MVLSIQNQISFNNASISLKKNTCLMLSQGKTYTLFFVRDQVLISWDVIKMPLPVVLLEEKIFEVVNW